MTYQEKFVELREEFAKASDKYLKIDKEISEVNGFGDISLVSKFQRAQNEWEIAGNNYNNFLSYTTNNKINPNDECGI